MPQVLFIPHRCVLLHLIARSILLSSSLRSITILDSRKPSIDTSQLTWPPHQRPVCNATQKHSLSDKVLQHGGLSRGLASHHGNLGQVDDHGHAQAGEGVLHPVDDGDEGLHALVARGRHDEGGGGETRGRNAAL